VNVTAIGEHAPRALKHPVHPARKARGDRLEPARQFPCARCLDDHVDMVGLRVSDQREHLDRAIVNTQIGIVNTKIGHGEHLDRAS